MQARLQTPTARPLAIQPPSSRFARNLLLWVAVGLLGYALLPWYFLQKGTLTAALPLLFSNAEVGSGLAQASQFGRVWLWGGVAGMALTCTALLWRAPLPQGRMTVVGALLGLLTLGLSGFSIGMVGWSFDWMNNAWGPLSLTQPGMGWGGFVVILSLVALLSVGIARMGYFKGDAFVAGAVMGCVTLLALFVVYPVVKSTMSSVYDDMGAFSLGAFAERLATGRIWSLACLAPGEGGHCGVAWNTMGLALATAAGTTILGTLIALWAEREAKRLAKPLNVLAMLPIITPPFVVGLGLILLFGRAGLFNQFLEWAFGIEPTRWFYGFFGVWLAQLFAFTPIAFMIMRGVVQGVSPSMEEAAQTLRASPMQTFMTVTLPLLKPGLANAFLVGFIESMADFGNPIILGGQFAVLSTEIFFAIVGASLDPGRAAALSLLLTLFALLVFFIQRRVLGKSNYTTVTGKGDAGVPMALPGPVRRVCYSVAGPWLTFTLVVYLFAFAGGFVQTWGRDYTFTLKHFIGAFDVQWSEFGIIWAGTAWDSLFTTMALAAMAAPVCAALGLLIAWLLARTEFKGKGAFEFAALLTFAIPGTVLGLSYILAFNVPPVELTGTGLIIVLCFIFRNLPVGVRAGTASFKQLDKSLDEASWMLHASTLTTLRRVVLPLMKSALVAALVYSFVRSMTTVSAVIFLVTAKYDLATTYIIGQVGNGAYGLALAYCTVLIILMSLITMLLQWVVGDRRLGQRSTVGH